MKVTSRGLPFKNLQYGIYILTQTEFKELFIIAMGTSIANAIQIAE